jgi:hypothetical protein
MRRSLRIPDFIPTPLGLLHLIERGCKERTMFRCDDDLVELTEQIMRLADHWERVAILFGGGLSETPKKPPQIILLEEANS